MLAVEDRIVFESTCGPWTDCAGWRVEAWPSGQLRIEGIDGVAQRGISEYEAEISKWEDAIFLLEAFDWTEFERLNAIGRPADCPSRSFRLLVRWERRDAPAREASVESYCASNPGHVRANAIRRELEMIFMGPPPSMPP